MQAIPEGASPAASPPRHIVVAVDGSDVAATAVFWAARLLATRREDSLHLARVLSVPIQSTAMPVAPGGAVAALAASLQHSREEERAETHAYLRTLEKDLLDDPQRVCTVRLHCLNPAGGASGVAESLVLLASRLPADALVLGCRGLGALTSALASLAGLGSVSGYCLHSAPCAVAVVPSTQRDPAALARTRVLVALDDSPPAQRALHWAAGTGLLAGAAAVDLVTATIVASDEITPPESPSARVLEREEREAEARGTESDAKQLLEDAKTVALRAGAESDKLNMAVLSTIHGSGVGHEIVAYAKAHDVGVTVVGARGLGAVRSAMLSLVGLGSVSAYVSRHLQAPTIVVREPKQSEQGEAQLPHQD